MNMSTYEFIERRLEARQRELRLQSYVVRKRGTPQEKLDVKHELAETERRLVAWRDRRGEFEAR